jgi:hypothetical protein
MRKTMRPIPHYIEKAGVRGAPIAFKWTGAGDHIGPIEGTALHDAFDALTKCAAINLAVGLEEWVVWRFDGQVERQLYQHHLDSVLAWAIDVRYRKPGLEKEEKEPVAAAAMYEVADLLRYATSELMVESPTARPSGEVHVAFFARHVMPKESRKSFDAWTKWALGRLKELAPRPTEAIEFDDFDGDESAYFDATRPYWGVALPLEALDPEFGYQPEMRQELLDRFLRSLNYEANPFLRSPEELKEAGFEGTPYRL